MIKKKLLVYELNEFSKELILDLSEKFNFNHLKWLSSLNYIKAETLDTHEKATLEPWVQWVSVHTGTPYSQHLIKNLSDVENLKLPQIWETLSLKGYSSGIWGVLNGKLGNTPQNKFFIPDPWTFSENGNPKKMHGFVDFVRYLATHRTSFSILKAIPKFLNLIYLFPTSVWIQILKDILPILKALFFSQSKQSACFLILEYINALNFISLNKKNRPDLSILFMNSLAHYQHYYWNEKKIHKNSDIFWCLFFIDKTIELLKISFNDDYHFIIMNALSQINTNHEPDFLLYKITNYELFFKEINLSYKSIEALMSYDAKLIFSNQTEAQKGIQKLRQIHVQNKPLFEIKEIHQSPLEFLILVDFYNQSTPQTQIQINTNLKLNFNDYLTFLIRRTAKHTSQSDVFTDLPLQQTSLLNHDILTIASQLVFK